MTCCKWKISENSHVLVDQAEVNKEHTVHFHMQIKISPFGTHGRSVIKKQIQNFKSGL